MRPSPVGERSWVAAQPTVCGAATISRGTSTDWRHFLTDLRGHHVLMCIDNTAVVSYINHQGGLRSRPLYSLAHQILVWTQGKLLLLRAVNILIREQTSCRGRGRGSENGDSTQMWWVRFGECLARLRWICLRLRRHHTVPSGSLWLIQLLLDWMPWYRLGQGFICTPFPRLVCSWEFWRECAGTGSVYC